MSVICPRCLISINAKERECVVCGKSFLSSRDGSNCSSKCKQRAYRQLKKNAKIAEECGL